MIRILVDTNIVWGILNKNDPWHIAVKSTWRSIRERPSLFCIPQIVLIEGFGHATRQLQRPRQSSFELAEARRGFLKELDALRWEFLPQHESDIPNAKTQWQSLPEANLEFADHVFAATAARINSEYIWTFDASLEEYIKANSPNIKLVSGATIRDMN